MKMKQKLLSSAIATSALALSALAPVAQAEVEVSASIGAASMYYWRGFDLGNGAAVSGDLSVSTNGFYAGLWTSSGDTFTEYDIYFGYATEFGGLSVDLGFASYIYPEAYDDLGDHAPVAPFDAGEVILGLGYGDFSLTYFHGVEDLEDYWYVVAGVDVGSFSFAFGLHEDDYSHLDITYNYNDNVAFTLGLVVDDADGGPDGDYNDEAKFLVSFSLPLDF